MWLFFRLIIYFPCLRYAFLALFRDVAEYLVFLPCPCRVSLGFPSIKTPPESPTFDLAMFF